MSDFIKKEIYLAQLDCIQTEIYELSEEMDGIEIEMEIKGSLVFKYIKCGKVYCPCVNGGADLHGPYPHIQRWENGKIKTKYLNRSVYPKYREQMDKIKRKKEIARAIINLKNKKRKLEKEYGDE